MSVVNGQPVSAAITNPAFLKPDVTDYTVSLLGMQCPTTGQGYYIQGIQKYVNNLAQVVGLVYTGNYTAENDTTGNTYGSTSTIISNGVTFKAAITTIANAFGSSGHAHTGSGSDGAKIGLTTGVTGVLPLANGGTNANLTASAGAIPYSTGSALALLAAGTAGQILTSNGTSAPSWGSGSSVTPTYIIPVVQEFPSGSGTYYPSLTFLVTSANATVGATYTNNGATFTILRTISAGTQLACNTTSGSPLSSGTLTKASGTGDSTITFTSVAYPISTEVEMVGGGAGGNGSGTSSPVGTAGNNTTFGSNTASGGSAGSGSGSLEGGGGGTATVGTGIKIIAVSGGSGGGGQFVTTTNTIAVNSGAGGVSYYGGSGGPSGNGQVGNSGAPNSGSGGSGGAATGTSFYNGAGGGAGAFLRVLISPPVSVSYSVAGSVSGGLAGTGGYAGGGGASGHIVAIDKYQ